MLEDRAPNRWLHRSLSLIGVAVILAAFLAACSRGPNIGESPTPTGSKDFSIVVYQGQDVLGGQETHFSDVFHQNKPVVLNFWAGQCPPCRAEMSELQAVADDYA